MHNAVYTYDLYTYVGMCICFTNISNLFFLYTYIYLSNVILDLAHISARVYVGIRGKK